MKLKILFVLAFVAMASVVNAQTASDFPVKVLPTNRPGVIKMLYADEANEDVTITFLSDEGIVGKDKINGHYPKGFLKRYNVSKIDHKVFWIEVTSPRMSVTYRVEPTGKTNVFDTQLAKTTFNQLLVRQDN